MFKILNADFKKLVSANNYSIDEIIVAYYARHGAKRFIRRQLIRSGFKLRRLCSSHGYFIHAESHCGSDTDLPKTGIRQGPDDILS